MYPDAVTANSAECWSANTDNRPAIAHAAVTANAR